MDTCIVEDREQEVKIQIPQEWIANMADDFFEEYIEDTLKTDIPYFQITKDKIGLVLSIFSLEGKFANGYDLLLAYNSKKLEFWEALPKTELTRWRGPGPCRGGKDLLYIIANDSNTGRRKLGIVSEEIKCDWKDDIPISRQYFVQNNPKWYAWQDSVWVEKKDLPAQYNKSKIKILTVMYPGPVDVTGNGLWKSYNPLNWNSRGKIKYWPSERLEKCLKEAESLGDPQMLEQLRKLTEEMAR